MAEGYLGTSNVDIAATPFKDYTPTDWAVYFIKKYGQIAGGHHKTWVIDQVCRILRGTPVIVTEARWTGHAPEYRIVTGDPSRDYLEWVGNMTNGGEYDYDEGIAP